MLRTVYSEQEKNESYTALYYTPIDIMQYAADAEERYGMNSVLST